MLEFIVGITLGAGISLAVMRLGKKVGLSEVKRVLVLLAITIVLMAVSIFL
jgi:hypothetical protein